MDDDDDIIIDDAGDIERENAVRNETAETKEAEGFDMSTSAEWIYPTNYPVRDYQKNIVAKALFENTLVSLPTGLGKTFIAAVIMYNYHRWFPRHKVVFMAHSKPLVAQQVQACCDIMGISTKVTAELNGTISLKQRKLQWENRHIFFLTPQVFNNDLSRGLVAPESIRCLVVDEAHKALGNQAYCQAIRSLQPFNSNFRVLALSATPGDDMNYVKAVVENLLISHLELRNEEDPDIKKYLHGRKVEAIVVNLDNKIIEYRDQLLSVIEKYLRPLVQAKAIGSSFGSLSSFSLFLKQRQFVANPSVSSDQRGLVLSNFSVAISLMKATEELITHGLRSFLNKLLSIQSGEGATNNVHSRLSKDSEFTTLISAVEDYIGKDRDVAFDPNVSMARIQDELDALVVSTPPPLVYSHPKFVVLEELIIKHFETWSEKEEPTKVIVFCKSRPCTGEICNFLSRFRPLVKPMILIGQSNASVGSTSRGLKQSAQLEVMRKFRCGDYNTLIATSVGEEGLDVGEVDLIVNFDASRNSNTQVQRAGRTGRKREGRVVSLVTEGKEYQDYNVSLAKAKTMKKRLSNNMNCLPLYTNSPRLIPKEINPVCQEMFLKPPVANKTPQKVCNNADKPTSSKRHTKKRKNDKAEDMPPTQGSKKYDIRYALSQAPKKKKIVETQDDSSDSPFDHFGAVDRFKESEKNQKLSKGKKAKLKDRSEDLEPPSRNVGTSIEVIDIDLSPDNLLNEKNVEDGDEQIIAMDSSREQPSILKNFLTSFTLPIDDRICDFLDALSIEELEALAADKLMSLRISTTSSCQYSAPKGNPWETDVPSVSDSSIDLSPNQSDQKRNYKPMSRSDFVSFSSSLLAHSPMTKQASLDFGGSDVWDSRLPINGSNPLKSQITPGWKDGKVYDAADKDGVCFEKACGKPYTEARHLNDSPSHRTATAPCSIKKSFTMAGINASSTPIRINYHTNNPTKCITVADAQDIMNECSNSNKNSPFTVKEIDKLIIHGCITEPSLACSSNSKTNGICLLTDRQNNGRSGESLLNKEVTSTKTSDVIRGQSKSLISLTGNKCGCITPGKNGSVLTVTQALSLVASHKAGLQCNPNCINTEQSKKQSSPPTSSPIFCDPKKYQQEIFVSYETKMDTESNHLGLGGTPKELATVQKSPVFRLKPKLDGSTPNKSDRNPYDLPVTAGTERDVCSNAQSASTTPLYNNKLEEEYLVSFGTDNSMIFQFPQTKDGTHEKLGNLQKSPLLAHNSVHDGSASQRRAVERENKISPVFGKSQSLKSSSSRPPKNNSLAYSFVSPQISSVTPTKGSVQEEFNNVEESPTLKVRTNCLYKSAIPDISKEAAKSPVFALSQRLGCQPLTTPVKNKSQESFTISEIEFDSDQTFKFIQKRGSVHKEKVITQKSPVVIMSPKVGKDECGVSPVFKLSQHLRRPILRSLSIPSSYDNKALFSKNGSCTLSKINRSHSDSTFGVTCSARKSLSFGQAPTLPAPAKAALLSDSDDDLFLEAEKELKILQTQKLIEDIPQTSPGDDVGSQTHFEEKCFSPNPSQEVQILSPLNVEPTIVHPQLLRTSASPLNITKSQSREETFRDCSGRKVAVVRPMTALNVDCTDDTGWASTLKKPKSPSLLSIMRSKRRNAVTTETNTLTGPKQFFSSCSSSRLNDTPSKDHKLSSSSLVKPTCPRKQESFASFDCIPDDIAEFLTSSPFLENKQSTPLNKSESFNASSNKINTVKKCHRQNVVSDDELSDGALEAIKAVEDLEKNIKPAETSVKSAGSSFIGKNEVNFDVWGSDDSDDLFEKKTVASQRPESTNRQSNKNHKKKRQRKSTNPFLEDEAEVSDDCESASSQEDSSDLDEMDSSFLDERLAPTQAPDVDMTSRYLSTVKDARVVPGGFKIPQADVPNFPVCSQIEQCEEDYEYDSFCVDDVTELEREDMSALELAELILDKRKKRRRNETPESKPQSVKKKRRRIVIMDSSSDEEAEVNLEADHSSKPQDRNINPNVVSGKDNEKKVLVSSSGVVVGQKAGVALKPSVSPLVFIGSVQIASTPEITTALRAKWKFTIEVRSSPGADYTVSWRMGINRITLSDFCNGSPIAKAHIRDSILKLTEMFTKPVLLIEDDKNKAAPRTVGCYRELWTKHSAKRLARLHHAGIRTIFTKDREETAKIIALLTQMECVKGFGVPTEWKSFSPSLESRLRFLCTLPGINLGSALRLCQKFSSLSTLLSVCDSVTSLKRELDVPHSTALNIYQAIQKLPS